MRLMVAIMMMRIVVRPIMAMVSAALMRMMRITVAVYRRMRRRMGIPARSNRHGTRPRLRRRAGPVAGGSRGRWCNGRHDRRAR